MPGEKDRIRTWGWSHDFPLIKRTLSQDNYFTFLKLEIVNYSFRNFLYTHLKPIDGTAIDQWRELPEPRSEGASNGGHGKDDMKLVPTTVNEHVEECQGCSVCLLGLVTRPVGCGLCYSVSAREILWFRMFNKCLKYISIWTHFHFRAYLSIFLMASWISCFSSRGNMLGTSPAFSKLLMSSRKLSSLIWTRVHD